MDHTEWFRVNVSNEMNPIEEFDLFQIYEDRLLDIVPDECSEADCDLNCAEDYYYFYEEALKYAKDSKNINIFDEAWKQDMEQYVIDLLRGGTIEIEAIAFTDPNPATNQDIRNKVSDALEDISNILESKGIYANYRLGTSFKEIDSDYYLGIITYRLNIYEIQVDGEVVDIEKDAEYILNSYGIKPKKYEIVRKVNNTIPMYFKGDYSKMMFNEMVSNIRSQLIKDGYKITKKEIDLLINFKEEKVDNLVVYTCTIIVEDK